VHSFSKYTSLVCKSYGVGVKNQLRTLGFLMDKSILIPDHSEIHRFRDIQGLILRAAFQYTSDCNSVTPNITHEQKRVDMIIE